MTHFLDRIALSVVHLFDPCTSGNTGEIGCLVSGAFFKLWPKDIYIIIYIHLQHSIYAPD